MTSERRQSAAAQLQMTLTEARLQVLRSQINPHFLFNTLNSISTLAMKGEHDATAEMLARLSELLRVSLDDRCPHEVSLSRELEFLEPALEPPLPRPAARIGRRVPRSSALTRVALTIYRRSKPAVVGLLSIKPSATNSAG